MARYVELANHYTAALRKGGMVHLRKTENEVVTTLAPAVIGRHRSSLASFHEPDASFGGNAPRLWAVKLMAGSTGLEPTPLFRCTSGLLFLPAGGGFLVALFLPMAPRQRDVLVAR